MYTKGMFVPEKWDDSLIGRKVERSSNWRWDNQDGGPGNIGKIIGKSCDTWVRVKWSNNYTDSYPCKDLIFADNPKDIDYYDLTMEEAEQLMQKFIPGFYVGCELEIIRNTGFSMAYVGNKFSTKGLSLGKLKSTLENFSQNQRTCGIDPNNTCYANYLPEDLKVVDSKSLLEENIVMEPQDSKYDPYTFEEKFYTSSGTSYSLLSKEESKDKPDSSFEIEFVNSQLRKSGKKSKINF